MAIIKIVLGVSYTRCRCEYSRAFAGSHIRLFLGGGDCSLIFDTYKLAVRHRSVV
jgi:hypothetical protein